MNPITLESLAQRVEALELALAAKRKEKGTGIISLT
jgi:hypothetical protein